MIPKEALGEVKIIITHDNCPDGLASALILGDAYPAAEIRFVNYNKLADLKSEPGMLFCDICPAAETAQGFVEAGTIVLDHHATARETVGLFGDRGVFGEDSEECGATLALRLCQSFGQRHGVSYYKYKQITEFCRLSRIRDCWDRESPDWVAACRQAHLLMFPPREMLLKPRSVITNIAWLGQNQWLGDFLLGKQRKAVKDALRDSWRFEVPGPGKNWKCILVPTVQTSDVAEELHEAVDLVIGFRYFYDQSKEGSRGSVQQLQLSLRSHTDFDCADFCRVYGGGGHPRAAGVTLATWSGDPSPMGTIYSMVAGYEARRKAGKS